MYAFVWDTLQPCIGASMANRRMAGQALAAASRREPEMVDRRNAPAPVASPAANAAPRTNRAPAAVSAGAQGITGRPVERREAPPMAENRPREMPANTNSGPTRIARRPGDRPEMRPAGPAASERRAEAPVSYSRSAAAPANSVSGAPAASMRRSERVEERRPVVSRPAERPQERRERPEMSHLRGYVAKMRERRGSAAQQQPQYARSAANTRG